MGKPFSKKINFELDGIGNEKSSGDGDSCTMTTHTKVAVTLSNSIIGVSILAMPFCMKQCGIVLGTLLLFSSSLLTRFTCHLLLKSALVSRRKTFEFVAFHTFGPAGKLAAELNIIGFMLGILISFYVVIGDLGPAIISRSIGIQNNQALRSFFLVVVGTCVALPLAMLKEVDSLARISTLSILFYMILSLKTAVEALPVLISGKFLENIIWWDPAGILHSLPIFALAMSCQTQIFEIYDALPDPSLKHMNSVVKVAVYICTSLYFFVGFFGYVANYDAQLTGNILMSYSPGFVTEVIKLFFVLSVALSFPLVILPCRASIHSSLFRRSGGPFEVGGNYIPDTRFKAITAFIVMITLIIGILCPNIEMVLGFIGSTIGIITCIIFPAMMFIQLTSKYTFEKWGAQLVLVSGILLLASCTWVNLDFANVDDENHVAPEILRIQQANLANREDSARANKLPGDESAVSSPGRNVEKATHRSGSAGNSDTRGQISDSHIGKPVKADCVGNFCSNGTDGIKHVKASEILPAPDAQAKDITKKPADEKNEEHLRHEPPVPQEPEESNNAEQNAVEPVKQGENINGAKKDVEINLEAIKKEDTEMEAKDTNDMKKPENHLSLNKQEEILKKLEEQQEQQKKILEEQKFILEELRAHGKRHDDEIEPKQRNHAEDESKKRNNPDHIQKDDIGRKNSVLKDVDGGDPNHKKDRNKTKLNEQHADEADSSKADKPPVLQNVARVEEERKPLPPSDEEVMTKALGTKLKSKALNEPAMHANIQPKNNVSHPEKQKDKNEPTAAIPSHDQVHENLVQRPVQTINEINVLSSQDHLIEGKKPSLQEVPIEKKKTLQEVPIERKPPLQEVPIEKKKPLQEVPIERKPPLQEVPTEKQPSLQEVPIEKKPDPGSMSNNEGIIPTISTRLDEVRHPFPHESKSAAIPQHKISATNKKSDTIAGSRHGESKTDTNKPVPPVPFNASGMEEHDRNEKNDFEGKVIGRDLKQERGK